MLARPADAPQGMIRAHLATFPPREGIFRRVVKAILPQVDRLFIVFNGYDAVPADIAADPRIEAVVPDADVMDAGKFWAAPDPDDIVFLIDDDIGYPADYVQGSIAEASRIGWVGAVFGYLGLNFRDGTDGRPRGWKVDGFDRKLRKPTGCRMVGTGTALARGDAVPKLSFMRAFAGHADIGFALHALATGRRPWALPREAGWMTQDLPDELRASSLFLTHRLKQPHNVAAALRDVLAAPCDHAELRHTQFLRAAARSTKGA